MPVLNSKIKRLIDYNIEEAQRRRQLQGQTRTKFPSRITGLSRDLSVTNESNEASFPFNGYRVDFEAIPDTEEFDPIEFSFVKENQNTRNITSFYYPERIKEEARFRTSQNIPNPKIRQIRSNND